MGKILLCHLCSHVLKSLSLFFENVPPPLCMVWQLWGRGQTCKLFPCPKYGNARTDVVPGLPEEGRRGVETEGRFLGLKILVDQLVPGWTR